MADTPNERTIIVKRTLRLTERQCAVCGTTFTGWGRARFCSPTCRRKWDYDKHAEQRRASRMDRYWQRKNQQAEQRDAEE